MEKNTKAEGVLAVLDAHHVELLSAGDFSGEGCWFRDGDENKIVAEYTKARAAIAELIEASRKVQEHVAPLLVQNGDGYLDVMEAHRAALRAVGGA